MIEHFIISLVLSVLLSTIFLHDTTERIIWILVGSCVGTLIDLDHPLIVILVKNDAWNVIRKEITNPKKLMEEFKKEGRLYKPSFTVFLLHALNALIVFLTISWMKPFYSLITGASLFVHIVCDIKYYLLVPIK